MPASRRGVSSESSKRRNVTADRIQTRRQLPAFIEHHQHFHHIPSKRLHDARDRIQHVLTAPEARQPVVRQDNPEPRGYGAIARDGLA